jgi:hypothetical protein
VHEDKATEFLNFYNGLLVTVELRDTTIDLDFFWKNAGEMRLNILRRRDKSRSKRSGQITRPPQGGQKHRKLKKSIKLNNSLVSRN